MKTKFKLMLIVLISFISVSVVDAQNLQEVVHLKNGSIIRGDIIEQVPNESLKIKTADGSLFVYKMEEVAKITKEPYLNSSSKSEEEREDDKSYGWGRAPRYRGFIGESYILHTGDIEEDRTCLWTSHGCQINPYLYAGVGVGVNYWFDSESWSVPIFAHVRSELHKVFHKNFSPYLDAKIGYSVADCEGFYFAPQIGCHFYFGHSNAGISVGVGYTLQNYKINYRGDYNLNAGGLEFTVAFDI
jgi:hypothetical protein